MPSTKKQTPPSITDLAEQIGWSMPELARRSGYNYQTIRGWAEGMNSRGNAAAPPPAVLEWMATVAAAVQALPPPDVVHSMVLTHGGWSMTVAEWALHLSLSPKTIRQRLRDGLPMEQVLAPDRRPQNPGRPKAAPPPPPAKPARKARRAA